MDNLFNDDYELIYRKIKTYIFVIGIILSMLITLLFLKKNVYYQNIIQFNSDNKATIVVEKEYLEKVKQQGKIIIDNINYDYNIEKIEKREKMYLLDISFNLAFEVPDVHEYQIFLGKESMGKYIFRMIEGEL